MKRLSIDKLYTTLVKFSQKIVSYLKVIKKYTYTIKNLIRKHFSGLT